MREFRALSVNVRSTGASAAASAAASAVTVKTTTTATTIGYNCPQLVRAVDAAYDNVVYIRYSVAAVCFPAIARRRCRQPTLQAPPNTAILLKPPQNGPAPSVRDVMATELALNNLPNEHTHVCLSIHLSIYIYIIRR